MAVYKVPQDVEADDKLIGPFTFRQFVFLLILVGMIYFSYVLFTINFILVAIPLPFVVFFAALAFPWRKDQPTEVYLTALIHFWMKPRKRIWQQGSHQQHVQILAPKKVEHQFTDGMTNSEVRSRLKTLATSMDSRGWSSKNVLIPDVGGQQGGALPQAISDRLAMPAIQQSQSPQMAIDDSDDVMDEMHNPVAQNFDNLVNQATEDRKAEIRQQMMQQASNSDDGAAPDYNPYPNDMRQSVVSPAHHSAPQQTQKPQDEPVNPDAQGAILNLANNSDLNVSTIARQAEQAMQSGDTIELH